MRVKDRVRRVEYGELPPREDIAARDCKDIVLRTVHVRVAFARICCNAVPFGRREDGEQVANGE